MRAAARGYAELAAGVRKRAALTALLLSSVAAACVGSIGDDPFAGPSGAAGGSGGTPGAASGGASSTNPGGAPGVVDPPPTFLRRLTNGEYAQALVDLVGEPPGADVRIGLPDDPRAYGFDNDAEIETITTVQAQLYGQGAESIAKAVLASPPRLAQVVGCDLASGAACLTSFIQHFGRLAYRRPLTSDEVAGYLQTASLAGNATPTDSASAVLQAMLTSPYFLFRVELGAADPARPGLLRLNGFEVATRLAFFLLGTTPDDALLDSAQAGALDTPTGIATVASQMLSDPRAKAAVRRFYTQWLQIDDVASLDVDATKYPLWTPALQSAMAEESTRFVDSIVWTDGTSFLDLLTARYTFVNGDLAAVYGLPPGDGSWHRVDFDATTPRIGILTQPSVLALNSHADSVSATRRGLYVRTQFLCGEVPSPPPGVAGMPPPAVPGETERQQFARHTTDPVCASCHKLMDPIGWGLSGFDVLGNVRTVDAQGQPVEVDGQIQGLTPPDFNGPIELAQRVHDAPDFPACVAKSLFRFAYGVAGATAATPVIDQIQQAMVDRSYDFRQTMLALVTSDPFRYRSLPAAPGGGKP